MSTISGNSGVVMRATSAAPIIAMNIVAPGSWMAHLQEPYLKLKAMRLTLHDVTDKAGVQLLLSEQALDSR